MDPKVALLRDKLRSEAEQYEGLQKGKTSIKLLPYITVPRWNSVIFDSRSREHSGGSLHGSGE